MAEVAHCLGHTLVEKRWPLPGHARVEGGEPLRCYGLQELCLLETSSGGCKLAATRSNKSGMFCPVFQNT